MEIHVKDNAINSLEVGLKFYNKFLNNLDTIDISVNHYGNLKFSVMAIHNSIELLTKAILLDINEFLVFKSEFENDDILCELLREQYYNKKRKAYIAYHAVFSTNSYKTIEYGKSIVLLHKIFKDKISTDDYETLMNLAEYRNALTHLGYASIYEWYKILIVINKSLELILEFYINNLIKSEEYFNRKIKNGIVKTLKNSKEHLHGLWMASNEHTIDTINTAIDSYLNNGLVKLNSIEEDSEYGFYRKIDLTYNYKNKEINMSWQFKYSYLNESIIIIDKNSHIIAFISLDDNNLKFTHDEMGTPKELVEIGVLIPRGILNYEEDKEYNLLDKAKTSKVRLKSEEFSALVNMYLKNIDSM
jgi:hypothetical protein